uniref:Uncharacterized protein n=1 Tax=Anguilla anguilla TaxID=7936 RepID=A0A0E9Y0I1_ANGAN
MVKRSMAGDSSTSITLALYT